MSAWIIIVSIVGGILWVTFWIASLISIIIGYKEKPENKYLIPLGIIGICLFSLVGFIGLVYYYQNDCLENNNQETQSIKDVYLNAKYQKLLETYEKLQLDYAKQSKEFKELKSNINIYFKSKHKGAK